MIRVLTGGLACALLSAVAGHAQQLLGLFHVDELDRVGDGFLDEVIALSEENRDLTTEFPR